MATKDFMTYTPEGGVADTPTKVTVTVSKYYGRENREGVLRVTAQSDPSVYKDVTVINSGAAQQVVSVEANERPVPSNGGPCVFTISANSQTIFLKLYYTIGMGGLERHPVDITGYTPVLMDENNKPSTSFKISQLFQVRGLKMEQITAGKTGPYSIMLNVKLPANSDTSYRRYTLEAAITDDFSDSKSGTITQQQQGIIDPDPVSVDVAPETLTISADGGSDTFTITSDDDTVIS